MARGGMRIGEVLKLRFIDIQGRKLILKEPKSGKEQEIVFIPQKVADRLREYARQKCQKPPDRIFPISSEAARIMVLRAGNIVGIHLQPHDLRRQPRHMHPDPVFLLKLSVRSSSGTRIYRSLSYIWVRSATPKRYDKMD